MKNSFVLLFSKTALSELVDNLEEQQRRLYVVDLKLFNLATKNNKGFFFVGGSVCFSLHKLSGKSIFFSRWNLFYMKSCGFNDSLDIDTFIRVYFSFNKCFDVATMFSMFCVHIFMITPLQLCGRSKTAALHDFCQKTRGSFLTESL